jgi:hypothetical protein
LPWPGAIPESLAKHRYLQVLNMGSNFFSSLPTAWTSAGSGSRRLLASASYPLVVLRIPGNILTVGRGQRPGRWIGKTHTGRYTDGQADLDLRQT